MLSRRWRVIPTPGTRSPTQPENPKRAAVVIIASNQGLAGGYISSVLKESEALVGKLRDEGKEVVPFLVGRKSVSFYRFRHRASPASFDATVKQIKRSVCA